MNDTITILLATYNGEKYLRRQLNSLLSQTYTNWQLIIRDDLSGDNTTSIIQEYLQKHPQQIRVLDSKDRNIGSVQNFSRLLQAAGQSEYIMFCDQDDEWLTDKIEITYRKMKEEEKQNGKETPLLIFTNFQYADNSLQVIQSKENFEVNRWANISFSHLLTQNPVYGCTTMINKALAHKTEQIPAEAENHDYWIALVASFTGKVCYLNKKTLRYRQHGANISGSFDNNSFQKRFTRIIQQKGSIAILENKKLMLNKLKEMYYELMNATTKSILDNFLMLYRKNSFFLIKENLKNGVACQTASQTFLLYTSLFFYRNKKIK